MRVNWKGHTLNTDQDLLMHFGTDLGKLALAQK